jgi:hypothetical protein
MLIGTVLPRLRGISMASSLVLVAFEFGLLGINAIGKTYRTQLQK